MLAGSPSLPRREVRNFPPLFREARKQRGHELPDGGELIEELERWNRESYDLHVVQKVGRTPLELFESEEAGALNERLQQALAEKWSYPQLLDTLLTDEVERRDFKHHRAHERGVVLGQFLQFGRSSALKRTT